METGRESKVVAVFVAWLESAGWQVRTDIAWADVVAERGYERLIGEAKGITAEPGLDLDTLYGQLLRRMTPSQRRGTSSSFPSRSCPSPPECPERCEHGCTSICTASTWTTPSANTDRPRTPGGGVTDAGSPPAVINID